MKLIPKFIKALISSNSVAHEGMNGTYTTIGSSSGNTRVRLSKASVESLYRGWVYACITAKAEDVGDIELVLYKKQNDENVEIKNHPLLDLLYSPAQNITKTDLFNLTSQWIDLFGKAFWIIEKEGTSTRLVPVGPYEMSPVVDSDGVIVEWKRVWNVNARQFTKVYPSSEVLYFNLPNPFNISDAYSPLQGIYEWVETENNATDWNRNFFENNATPSLILKAQNAISLNIVERLRESFISAFQGIRNSHKVGVLPSGVEIEKLQESMKDMDFATLDERYQNKILAAFKVPKSRLGITTDVNRANAEASFYIYAKQAIQPQMERIVNTINAGLTMMYGKDLILGFVSPVPDDSKAQLEEVKAGLANQPYMTVNEARAMQGLEPIPNGDDVMGSFSFAPIGSIDPSTDTGQKNLELFKKKLDDKRKICKTLHRGDAPIESEEKSKLIDDLVKVFLNTKQKTIVSGWASPDFDETDHKNFVKRGNQYISKVTEAFVKITGQIEYDTIRNIEELVEATKSNTGAVEKALIDDSKAFLAVVVAGASSIFKNIVKSEGDMVASNLGFGKFEITAGISAQITKFVTKLSNSYEKTVRGQIDKVIRSGLTDGLGIDQIKRNLREDVFKGLKEKHAEMIALTETFRFGNIGLREAYSQSGVVKTVRWYTAEDERVCEYCGPLNGKIIDVNQPFFSEGEKMLGADGGVMDLNYSDVVGGPLHPRCRCYVRPDKISIV